eukprot:4719462-Amphidinium_carterae.1
MAIHRRARHRFSQSVCYVDSCVNSLYCSLKAHKARLLFTNVEVCKTLQLNCVSQMLTCQDVIKRMLDDLLSRVRLAQALSGLTV